MNMMYKQVKYLMENIWLKWLCLWHTNKNNKGFLFPIKKQKKQKQNDTQMAQGKGDNEWQLKTTNKRYKTLFKLIAIDQSYFNGIISINCEYYTNKCSCLSHVVSCRTCLSWSSLKPFDELQTNM